LEGVGRPELSHNRGKRVKLHQIWGGKYGRRSISGGGSRIPSFEEGKQQTFCKDDVARAKREKTLIITGDCGFSNVASASSARGGNMLSGGRGSRGMLPVIEDFKK